MSIDFHFDVLLSHNQVDKPRVRRLAERLPLQLGARNSELRLARLCLSAAALGSDWVGSERSTVGRGNRGSRDLRFRDPSNAGRRFHPG